MFFSMTVCLTSESCQQKKCWQAPTKHKNIHTFLVEASINNIMVSELPPDCPTIVEIEAEIKEYTSNLDSIMGAEMTTPPRKNLTPPRD